MCGRWARNLYSAAVAVERWSGRVAAAEDKAGGLENRVNHAKTTTTAAADAATNRLDVVEKRLAALDEMAGNAATAEQMAASSAATARLSASTELRAKGLVRAELFLHETCAFLH